MNNLTIRGARIVDGAGAPWYRGDVGVDNGLFVELGEATAGRLEVEAEDRVLAPGFIDMHSHNDLRLLTDAENATKVAQGVTTEVLGQDGLSCAPLLPGQEGRVRELIAAFDGEADAWSWSGVHEYLQRLDRRCAVNVAYLVPHGTIRAQVLSGEDRPAEPAEVDEMRALVAHAMRDGAFGMSTGLEYAPARNATFEELVDLLGVVASFGGHYVTHVRDFDRAYQAALTEAIEIGRRAAAPVQISHFVAWGRRHHGSMPMFLGMLEEARKDGIDATFDVYPYGAGSSVATYFFVDEVRMLAPDELRARLNDSQRRREIAALIDQGPASVDVGWESFFVAGGNETIGAGSRSLSEIAAQRGTTVGEVCCDLLDRTDLRATLVAHACKAEDVDAAVLHRLATIGSDGIPVGDRPHPRGCGTFARIIRDYVVERELLTLEAAIAAMTGRPASRLGLQDRGLIREGMAADLVLFDPSGVEDKATYENPRELARGIDLVAVNGRLVWRDEAPTGLLPGRALKNRHARGAQRREYE